MMSTTADERWMAAAIALSERGRALSAPNPNVGCLIVKQGRVIGRGWTQSGGRPHAEAVALAQAGEEATGATCYVTLEPCAHESERGGPCSDALILAGISRCVIPLIDPDARTAGTGVARMRGVGMSVEVGLLEAEARRAMAGWLMQQEQGRPFVTLKLATSLDGCIALANGESRWITGEAARNHGQLERARSNMILVGRGTVEADAPKLDVRLAGLEYRSPLRAVLSKSLPKQNMATRDDATTRYHDDAWYPLNGPEAILGLSQVQYLIVEGGAQTAASFLKAGLVDRLLLYRAPILLGGGKASLCDIGLAKLIEAHGIWKRTGQQNLGSDTVEVYDRA